MNIDRYTTLHIRKNEYQFFSEGRAGRFEMRICFTLIGAERELYNLGFGIYNPFVDQLDDKTELKNGDTNKILATVGHQTIKFLKQNPTASIVAAGSIVPGKLAIRTRKYQMGINSNYDFLSESHKVYGFIADKFEGQIIGDWPGWRGQWQVFDRSTNYDAFLLTAK